jgi:uracil-DNA glycosylase
VRLTLLVGQYAQGAYLPAKPRRSMTDWVRRHDEAGDGRFPLPHPVWRSRLWMTKHPWFEVEVLPLLRTRVAAALA